MAQVALSSDRPNDFYFKRSTLTPVDINGEEWLELTLPLNQLRNNNLDEFQIGMVSYNLVVESVMEDIMLWQRINPNELSTDIPYEFHVGFVISSGVCFNASITIVPRYFVSIRILPWMAAFLANEWFQANNSQFGLYNKFVGFRLNESSGKWCFVWVDVPADMEAYRTYFKRITISATSITNTAGRLSLNGLPSDNIRYAVDPCLLFSPFIAVEAGLTRRMYGKNTTIRGIQEELFANSDRPFTVESYSSQTPSIRSGAPIGSRPTDVHLTSAYVNYMNLAETNVNAAAYGLSVTEGSSVLITYLNDDTVDLDAINPLFMYSIGVTVQADPEDHRQPFIPLKNYTNMTLQCDMKDMSVPCERGYSAVAGSWLRTDTSNTTSGHALSNPQVVIEERNIASSTSVPAVMFYPSQRRISHNVINDLERQSIERYTSFDLNLEQNQPRYTSLSPWRNIINFERWRQAYDSVLASPALFSRLILEDCEAAYERIDSVERAFIPDYDLLQQNAELQFTQTPVGFPMYMRFLTNCQRASNERSWAMMHYLSTTYYPSLELSDLYWSSADDVSSGESYSHVKMSDYSLHTSPWVPTMARLCRPFMSFFSNAAEDPGSTCLTGPNAVADRDLRAVPKIKLNTKSGFITSFSPSALFEGNLFTRLVGVIPSLTYIDDSPSQAVPLLHGANPSDVYNGLTYPNKQGQFFKSMFLNKRSSPGTDIIPPLTSSTNPSYLITFIARGRYSGVELPLSNGFYPFRAETQLDNDPLEMTDSINGSPVSVYELQISFPMQEVNYVSFQAAAGGNAGYVGVLDANYQPIIEIDGNYGTALTRFVFPSTRVLNKIIFFMEPLAATMSVRQIKIGGTAHEVVLEGAGVTSLNNAMFSSKIPNLDPMPLLSGRRWTLDWLAVFDGEVANYHSPNADDATASAEAVLNSMSYPPPMAVGVESTATWATRVGFLTESTDPNQIISNPADITMWQPDEMTDCDKISNAFTDPRLEGSGTNTVGAPTGAMYTPIINQNFYRTTTGTLTPWNLSMSYPLSSLGYASLNQNVTQLATVWKDDSFCPLSKNANQDSGITSILSSPLLTNFYGDVSIHVPFLSGTSSEQLSNYSYLCLGFTDSPGLYASNLIANSTAGGEYDGTALPFTASSTSTYKTRELTSGPNGTVVPSEFSFFQDIPMCCFTSENDSRRFESKASTWGHFSECLMLDRTRSPIAAPQFSPVTPFMYGGTIGVGVGFLALNNRTGVEVSELGYAVQFQKLVDDTAWRGPNLRGGSNRTHYMNSCRSNSINSYYGAFHAGNTPRIQSATSYDCLIRHPLNILAIPPSVPSRLTDPTVTTVFDSYRPTVMNYSGLRPVVYRTEQRFHEPCGSVVYTDWNTKVLPTVTANPYLVGDLVNGMYVFSVECYETSQDSVTRDATIATGVIDLNTTVVEDPIALEVFDPDTARLFAITTTRGYTTSHMPVLDFYRVNTTAQVNGYSTSAKGFDRLHFRFRVNSTHTIEYEELKSVLCCVRLSLNNLSPLNRRVGAVDGERQPC